MSFFNIDPALRQLCAKAEEKAAASFRRIDSIAQYNSEKVLSAFINNHVSESHFAASTGYGYGDRGREVLDQVLAEILGCEDALIRYNFMSGTHALTVALFGVLRPGDRMVSLTGLPYDTLHGVIGLGQKEEVSGSLKDFGVQYEQLDLLEDGKVNYEGIPQAVKGAKVAYIPAFPRLFAASIAVCGGHRADCRSGAFGQPGSHHYGGQLLRRIRAGEGADPGRC